MGTGETRLRPSSETPAGKASPLGGLGATNPISGLPDEMGESGAGVGGGHSSDEGENNRTRRSEGAVLGRRVRLTKRQRDRREAIHPPNHVSKGRLLGREANARGRAECRAPTARGRAVCGRIACTVLLSMRRRYDAATLRALSRRGALRVLAPGPTVPSSGKPSPWFCLVDRPNQLNESPAGKRAARIGV